MTPVPESKHLCCARLSKLREREALLIFSGRKMPLLSAYATVTGGKPLDRAALRPDIVFEDFEHGYGRWKVEGEAFGREPAHGTLPNQQPVSGFFGQRFG